MNMKELCHWSLKAFSSEGRSRFRVNICVSSELSVAESLSFICLAWIKWKFLSSWKQRVIGHKIIILELIVIPHYVCLYTRMQISDFLGASFFLAQLNLKGMNSLD